jgi:cytochrome P450
MPVQTLLTIFFLERFASYCRHQFTSLATLRLAGLGRVVTVWDPELISSVFTGDPGQWHAGEANAKALLGPAGPSSVLVLDGERHMRLRRLLLPPFHGEAVRKYRELIVELTAAEVKRWPTGEEFAVHPRIQALTLEVILRAVIGVGDERRLERLRALLKRSAGANLFAFLAEGAYPGMADNVLGSHLPWISARREADELLYEEIAAHRARPVGRADVLALLIAAAGDDGRALNDQELRDQLATLLVAGHDTTATALAWCFERLVHNPRTLRRLEEEVIGGGEEDGYLDAVVNETLRVRPVIDAALRRLTRPAELAGYSLPAGTFVAASILGVQVSEAFERPQEFRPERFLKRPAQPYTLIPFGGGAHRCVGASFAVMEMKTILRTVIERVELRAAFPRSERPVRWRRFTVMPTRGGRVIATPRGGWG